MRKSATFALSLAARGWGVTLGPDAATTGPSPASHLPGEPPAPALAVSFRIGGAALTLRAPLEVPPLVLPARSVSLSPLAAIVNRAAPARPLDFAVRDISPDGARPEFVLPSGWRAEASDTLRVIPPEAPEPGPLTVPLTLDGEPAQNLRLIATPMFRPAPRYGPPRSASGCSMSRCRRLASGTSVADRTVSGTGWRRWVTTPTPSPTKIRFRSGLAAAMPRLHRWVEAGGTLVTLYHRPWDGWDPDTIPPRRLEIGQPSLRWRVTDENPEVEYLAADHPLLNTPNRIGPEGLG